MQSLSTQNALTLLRVFRTHLWYYYTSFFLHTYVFHLGLSTYFSIVFLRTFYHMYEQKIVYRQTFKTFFYVIYHKFIYVIFVHIYECFFTCFTMFFYVFSVAFLRVLGTYLRCVHPTNLHHSKSPFRWCGGLQVCGDRWYSWDIHVGVWLVVEVDDEMWWGMQMW